MNFGDSTALHHLRLPCEYWFRTISTIHHELTSLCFNVSFFAFTQLLFPVAHKCSPTTLAVPCAGGRIRFMSDLLLSLPPSKRLSNRSVLLFNLLGISSPLPFPYLNSSFVRANTVPLTSSNVDGARRPGLDESSPPPP